MTKRTIKFEIGSFDRIYNNIDCDIPCSVDRLPNKLALIFRGHAL